MFAYSLPCAVVIILACPRAALNLRETKLDILKKLDPQSDYSAAQLQLIIGAWVLSAAFDRRQKIAAHDGSISEDDYDKQSIYSLLYSLYRSMGVVHGAAGEPYELTFNTWGYAWPAGWGECPNPTNDPQKFGKNAYTGLYEFAALKDYVRARKGCVHVVELGSGTGAGAHHVCKNVLPRCTYEAIDMQMAATKTCRRKFVPELHGRLVATCANGTRAPVADAVADIVAICETHVTEHTGLLTAEDKQFFRTAYRIMKPGGFLVWGNAIPDANWAPCFEFLESLGMKRREVRDVTGEAVRARDEDEPRVHAYVKHCIERFPGFRIPFFGDRRRAEATSAMKNFYRNPGTRLYENMTSRRDTYMVVAMTKPT